MLKTFAGYSIDKYLHDCSIYYSINRFVPLRKHDFFKSYDAQISNFDFFLKSSIGFSSAYFFKISYFFALQGTFPRIF